MRCLFVIIFLFISLLGFSQNSMVGDGFGGRKWYQPTNYSVGSYSAYSSCYNECNDSIRNVLYGWGSNHLNQLGYGSISNSVSPILIPNMNNTKYVSAGYYCGAIKNDNTGWAWGQTIQSPIQIINNVKFLNASSTSISYVLNDGTVWSIGDNSRGKFGDGNTNPSFTNTPTQMLNINNAVRISASFAATFILLKDSSLMAVGGVTYPGQLGLGFSTQQTMTPLPIPGLPKIIDIKSSKDATIALSTNGDVYLWGYNYGSSSLEFTPILVDSLNDIVSISGCDDGSHFLALNSKKECYSFGKNNEGQCGVPISAGYVYPPKKIDSNVIDIMAGETFSYIVKDDFSLWATGNSRLNRGSIWLNLNDSQRVSLTQIQPFCKVDYSPQACDTNNNLALIKDSIFFPNIFTPNYDGENDVFHFPNQGLIELKCEIYNRWGLKLYQWDDINGSWDGKTTSGKDSPDGVYYYLVSFKKQNSELWERHKGFVTLLR